MGKCGRGWIAGLVTLSSALAWAAEAPDWRTIKPKSEAQLKALFDRPIDGLESPVAKDVYVYKSELTPAIILRSRLSTVRLFDQMKKFGLDGPTHVAYPTSDGIKVIGRGEVPGPLSESWILVWFTGGDGWDRIRHSQYAQNNIKDAKTYAFDVPFLISLQHKPTRISVGADGVDLTFSGEAGIVQWMPLMGVNRPAPDVTAQWTQQLPAEISQQASSWNKRLKFIPVQVTESYVVDAAKDLVTLVHDFRFVEAKDDWGTAGAMDAPISPAIALAAAHGLPLQFSAKTSDTLCPTYFGPLWVVPGARQVRIDVPGILNLITKVSVPNIAPGQDADLLARIDGQLAKSANATGMGWWAAAGAAMSQGNKSALMPYATARTAETIKAAAMRLMHENVFGGERTTDRLIDEKRGRVYLVDYVNHHVRYAGDDESPASEIVRGAFDYAFYTGDWQTIRDHWADLQAAAVGSYVKNNWILQSRMNSGGDTYHDVLAGTANMARMAAVLGKEQDFGLFSYLLARHLIAYYGFEYAALVHARQYQPWFITLTDEPMLVWDMYGPFGGMFTPYSKEGFYGPYSGFYEHYYRMDDDIMPRYYRRFLPEHMKEIFGEMVEKHVPNPAANDGSKWSLLFQIRARFLGWDRDKLKAWVDTADWKGKDNSDVTTALYDARHPRQLFDIVNPKLRKPVLGSGVQYQSDGLGHFSLDIDADTQREPGAYWFGLNAANSQVKAAHNGNTIVFGVAKAGDGKVVGRDSSAPNWVTRTYGYDVSQANDASKAAAAEQARAKWMIVGPFGEAGAQKEDWDTAFTPEQQIDLAARYPGPNSKGDGEGAKKGSPLTLAWQARTMKDGKDTANGAELPDNTLSCRWGFNHFGYSYLYTRVFAPKAAKIKVGISSTGGQKVWINKALAFQNQRNAGRVKEDDRMFDASLNAGWNDVLVKIKNATFWETFFFRIMDEDEQAIPGLKYDPQGK